MEMRALNGRSVPFSVFAQVSRDLAIGRDLESLPKQNVWDLQSRGDQGTTGGRGAGLPCNMSRSDGDRDEDML